MRLLRLALRLGQTYRNAVVAQVLYRLELAEKLKGVPGAAAPLVSSERAAAMAEAAEAANEPPLDFTCTILLLGKARARARLRSLGLPGADAPRKSGVGKSATLNSLLGAGSSATSAFDSETKTARSWGARPWRRLTRAQGAHG